MTGPAAETMAQILLIGTETPLLEGLAQSFAALGLTTSVIPSLHEAREIAAQQAPLIAIVSHALAAESTGETLNIPLAPGGALVLYRSGTTGAVSLSPTLQRAVLADLALPLERNRLIALVQHVGERAKTTGRGFDDSNRERPTRA
jgi:DNA-binding NtrC family response regulator